MTTFEANKTKLTKEERLNNRIRILFQQLQVIEMDYESFEDNLGKRGVNAFIDDILDEINERKRELTKIKKSKDNDR